MSNSNNYSFFNIPKKYSVKDYKESIEYIIKIYSKIKNLTSIYEWGKVSAPGISDIDIVFVFDKDAKALPFLKRSFYFLNAKARCMVGHPFVFIDATSFQNIKHIYQRTDFKLLYGQNIKMKDLKADDMYYTAISLLNDIIIRHYPRDFIHQSVNKCMNVRGTLLRLNSLNYSINLFEILAKERYKSWTDTVKYIQKLRKGWFESKDFNLLISLNERAMKISMEIIDGFRKFLLKNRLVKINIGNRAKYNGIKNRSLFIRNWDKEKSLQEMIKIIRSKQKFYSILPLELSTQLIEYSKYKGEVSDYIRKNINYNINYKIRYKNIIEQKIKIINNQAELASKLKHSDFAAFFDFGYRNKSGVNNWILNLLDKVRF